MHRSLCDIISCTTDVYHVFINLLHVFSALNEIELECNLYLANLHHNTIVLRAMQTIFFQKLGLVRGGLDLN